VTFGSDSRSDPDDGKHLSPRQREISELQAEGHSYAEIAEILGISDSTVRLQAYRARQKPTRGTYWNHEAWPGNSFVGRLADVDRAALLEVGTPLRFEDDEFLLFQGATGDFLFVLTSGLVKLFVHAENNSQTTLAIRSRGDLIGEHAVLDNKPQTATASASGRVTALRIYGADFLALAGRSPSAQAAVTGYLVDQVRFLTERLAAERIWDARPRLAQVLYQLAEEYGQPDSGGLIRIPITQTDLGELAGVAASTMGRVMRDLKERGIVSTRYREITIRDLGQLASIRFRQGPYY
jgi:CRP-like cAMP-binding protein